MVRIPTFENGVKKGAWSPEEDHKLRTYILQYGHLNWRELPKRAGLARCGKSCRLRWINYLRPDLKRGNFTKEEEDLILELHAELGNKWSKIAAKLPGRTDNEIKNHWHTHLKKRWKQQRMTKASSVEAENSNEASQKTGSTHHRLFPNNINPKELCEKIGVRILESSPLSPQLSSTISEISSSKTTHSNQPEISTWSMEEIRETETEVLFDDIVNWNISEIISSPTSLSQLLEEQSHNADSYSCGDDGFLGLDYQNTIPQAEDVALFSPYVSFYDENFDIFSEFMPGN